jgi:hypothetical protein
MVRLVPPAFALGDDEPLPPPAAEHHRHRHRRCQRQPSSAARPVTCLAHGSPPARYRVISICLENFRVSVIVKFVIPRVKTGLSGTA